jgi:hypothetical protein
MVYALVRAATKLLLVKNLIFTLVVPGTIGVYVPLFIAREQASVSGACFAIALAMLAAGGALYAWVFVEFRCSWSRYARSDRCAEDARHARALPLCATRCMWAC